MDPQKAMKKIKMLVRAGTLLWLVGLVLILVVFFLEFVGYWSTLSDSTSSRTLMTFKLGGIGFILSGVFLSLVAIVNALALMPEKLASKMKK